MLWIYEVEELCRVTLISCTSFGIRTLLVWRNILGLNTLQLPSQNIGIQTYTVSYRNSTRLVSWTLRQSLKEKEKATKYRETFHNFLSKGTVRDTIVKLFEPGLSKIQNSRDNTLVLRRDELDKSMFFPYLLTYMNRLSVPHTSKKITPKQSAPFRMQNFCEHLLLGILHSYRIN